MKGAEAGFCRKGGPRDVQAPRPGGDGMGEGRWDAEEWTSTGCLAESPRPCRKGNRGPERLSDPLGVTQHLESALGCAVPQQQLLLKWRDPWFRSEFRGRRRLAP